MSIIQWDVQKGPVRFGSVPWQWLCTSIKQIQTKKPLTNFTFFSDVPISKRLFELVKYIHTKTNRIPYESFNIWLIFLTWKKFSWQKMQINGTYWTSCNALGFFQAQYLLVSFARAISYQFYCWVIPTVPLRHCHNGND